MVARGGVKRVFLGKKRVLKKPVRKRALLTISDGLFFGPSKPRV
jgi:hypothetical protein